ncbi:MAG: hypothetical protein H7X79_00630 [Sporomusaceae bacterium]|nr:hypothetical protein [Sporomusaceae bacterium]
MKDFCGVNGCYDIEVFEDCEVVSVYVNRPIVYEGDGTGKYTRILPENRTGPDIEFVFEPSNEDGDCDISQFTVYSAGDDGVQAFVSMLMKEKIDKKNGLIKAIETLLEQPGAIWGETLSDNENL